MGEKKEKMKEYMKYKYLIDQKDKNCKVKEGKSKKGSEKNRQTTDHEDEMYGVICICICNRKEMKVKARGGNKRQQRRKESFWLSNLNCKILKDYLPHLYHETTLMDGALRNLVQENAHGRGPGIRWFLKIPSNSNHSCVL